MVRVHGAEGVASIAAVSTVEAELQAGAAWQSRNGRLQFGRLDHRLGLHARFVGEAADC